MVVRNYFAVRGAIRTPLAFMAITAKGASSMTENNQQRIAKAIQMDNRVSFHEALDAVERDIDEWRKSQVWWD